jgi:ATP-dependent exoDNAse (exonuclease V) alpha subunit
MRPTEEQQAALDVFTKQDSLVLEAGAGTGKTTTLKLLAESTNRKGLYVAYNRAIAQEAATKFPARADCRTAHSLAFRAIGRKYSARLNSGFTPWGKVAKFLGITERFQAGERTLTTNTLARLAMEMVTNFCNSADPHLRSSHRPYVEA